VPTELAVAESERLVLALAEEDIAVNHLVLNQVIRVRTTEFIGILFRARRGTVLPSFLRN
jgi:anion-transporting  ArsA/GET3 family ATPase